MKKKKIELGKKLFLGKETVVNLTGKQQGVVMGGASEQGPGSAGACCLQSADLHNTCFCGPTHTPVATCIGPCPVVTADGGTFCGSFQPSKISCAAGPGCTIAP